MVMDVDDVGKEVVSAVPDDSRDRSSSSSWI